MRKSTRGFLPPPSAGQISFLMFVPSLRSPLSAPVFLCVLLVGSTAYGYGLNSRHHRLGRQIDTQVALDSTPPAQAVDYSHPQTNLTQNKAHSGLSDISYMDTTSVQPFLLHPRPKPLFGSDRVSTLSAEATTCANGPLVMGYYPDWAGDDFPPEKIDFTRYNWIDFAFAVPMADYSIGWDDEKAPDTLRKLVQLAHAGNAKVKLSIGGWTGSKYFSDAVSSEDNRAIFVQNIFEAYKTFDIDGIDIDWEYPGRLGATGNHLNSGDSTNFLSFLQLLRKTLPPDARISAAVETQPFQDADGNIMEDVSDFAAVLDWVLIMNYDLWGASSNPGPNAPLNDGCGNSTQPEGSAVAAYKAWTKANFPACQLVLGLPSYGYVSKSKAEKLRVRAKSKKPKKDKYAIVTEDGGDESQIQFVELVKQGVLVPQSASPDQNPTPYWRSFGAAHGFERRWDDCSNTPFLRSSVAGQVVTYDDPYSLALKAAFAKEVGMLGVNMFDVHGDTEGFDLIDSVRRSLGAQ